MPLISPGYNVLATYPDNSSKRLTLYAEPVVGQVIAHGWKVVTCGPSSADRDGLRLDFEITVERPRGAP